MALKHDGGGQRHLNAQGVGRRQRHDGNGDGGTVHVDGSAQLLQAAEYQRIRVAAQVDSGCLVVIDYDQEKTKILEDMGMIYGYTCFYKIFNIPHDYTSNPEKYSPVGFKKKTKEELEAEVITFFKSSAWIYKENWRIL